MKCLFFNGLCHLIGERHYESNCYSGAQLPLMGVAGLQSTLRSISVHYSMNPHICQILKLCILKNTLKPVSNKRFKISTKAPLHTWCRWHRFLILYKKYSKRLWLPKKIGKYGRNFDEDPISIPTLSPPTLKPNFYELPIVKMRISRARVWGKALKRAD